MDDTQPGIAWADPDQFNRMTLLGVMGESRLNLAAAAVLLALCLPHEPDGVGGALVAGAVRRSSVGGAATLGPGRRAQPPARQECAGAGRVCRE